RTSSWNWGRRAGDAALVGFLDGNVIRIQDSAGRSRERNSGLFVSSLGRHFRGARLRQKVLVLNDQIVGRKPDIELLRLHLDGLLLQDPALHGGFIRRTRLLQ